MANTLSVIDMVTREALRIAHEKLSFIGTIDRSYDSSYAKSGAKIGDTLRVRNPNQYVRRKGSRVMDVQDQEETTQSVTVATQDGVDMKFNSAELSLSIDELSRRYIEPATAVLVSGIESDVLAGVTKAVYQNTGTTTEVVGATDLDAISQARAKLNQQLAPKDNNRCIQMDSVTMAAVATGQRALFNDQGELSTLFREGYLGRFAGTNFYENDRTYAHTNSSDADVAWAVDDVTRLAAYTDADGLSVLNFDAMGTVVPTVGTTFTIADLYDCHPETKQKYAHLKQFTITAVGTVASNQADITFSPTIRTGGAKQNCWISGGSASISDLEDNVTAQYGAGGSLVYQSNLMYHRDAFTFVTADLPLMDDAIRCVRRVQDGLAIRVWQGSDIRNDELLLRMDILYGYKALRPEWACRVNN
jgi:hypothetical protein